MTGNRGEIFAPLDSGERLPRESLREGRRGLQLYRVDVDRRGLSHRELAAVLAFPALFLLLALLGWVEAGAALAVGAVLLLILGLVVLAFSGRRRTE